MLKIRGFINTLNGILVTSPLAVKIICLYYKFFKNVYKRKGHYNWIFMNHVNIYKLIKNR